MGSGYWRKVSQIWSRQTVEKNETFFFREHKSKNIYFILQILDMKSYKNEYRLLVYDRE